MRNDVWAYRPFSLLVAGAICALILVGGLPQPVEAARPDVSVLHTYATANAWEVSSAIAVNATSLLPLLPSGYQLVPASALGVGSGTQGVVGIVNFQGRGSTIDGRPSGDGTLVAIDVGILVVEPAEAALVGANVPGALHLYTLAIYANDARYVASLQSSGLPVEHVKEIGYDRQFDDTTGFGTLTVKVPNHRAPFRSVLNGLGYQLQSGALNGVFWYRDHQKTAALHFQDQPFLQGQAFGQVYLPTDSDLGRLVLGGGFGPCPPGPGPRVGCVTAPALNFRYPQGTHGTLSLIRHERDEHGE